MRFKILLKYNLFQRSILQYLFVPATHSSTNLTFVHAHTYIILGTVSLLNQKGRNNYPNNPKYGVNTGNRTGDDWLTGVRSQSFQ